MFKAITLYRFKSPGLDSQVLEAALDRVRFVPCGATICALIPLADRMTAWLSAPSPSAQAVPPLTDRMIDAADEYLRQFKHWRGLPAQFRWHELWDAMTAATHPQDTSAEGGV